MTNEQIEALNKSIRNIRVASQEAGDRMIALGRSVSDFANIHSTSHFAKAVKFATFVQKVQADRYEREATKWKA